MGVPTRNKFRTSQVVFCLNDLDVSIQAVVDRSLADDKVGLDWTARRGSDLDVSYILKDDMLVVTVDKKSRRSVAACRHMSSKLPDGGVEGDVHTARTPDNTPFVRIREPGALRYAGKKALELRLYFRFAGCKYAIIP